MSFPFSKLAFTGSRAGTTALLGISLVAVGTALYLSPAGGTTHRVDAATEPVVSPTPGAGAQPTPSPSSASPSSTPTSPAPTHSATPPKAVPTSTHAGGSTGGGSGYTVIHAPAKTDVVVVKEKIPTPGPTVTKAPAIPSCSDFTWQQDAQAAYLANLSDPGGLDGAKGPNNGDGIACNQLPSDPNRPASIPVDPYVAPAPTAAEKATLVDPTSKYFGVAEDGLPGDTSILTSIDKEIGKAPNLIEYFQTLDDSFRGDLVQKAWSQGALPVVTMQTTGSVSGADYSLQSIVNGNWDAYFIKYAADIRATDLPLALRFDHEMNGNWYPWSAGLPANQGAAGQPNLYVQAWRHVWTLFQDAGANADVIWLWAPIRIDGLTTADTGQTCKTTACQYQTTLAQDYPGDQYVDWVGFSGYAWKTPTSKWHPANTYGATINALDNLTSKPIFIAETAAAKAYGGTAATSTAPATPGQDTTAEQAEWISEALPYIAANSHVIGFVYFNNDSTSAHVVDGQTVETDWKLDDSPGALTAFKAGITDARFGSGIMPDSSGE